MTAWKVAGMDAPVAPDGVNAMKSPSLTCALPPVFEGASLAPVGDTGIGDVGLWRGRTLSHIRRRGRRRHEPIVGIRGVAARGARHEPIVDPAGGVECVFRIKRHLITGVCWS
jgi:hypothetical protein